MYQPSVKLKRIDRDSKLKSEISRTPAHLADNVNATSPTRCLNIRQDRKNISKEKFYSVESSFMLNRHEDTQVKNIQTESSVALMLDNKKTPKNMSVSTKGKKVLNIKALRSIAGNDREMGTIPKGIKAALVTSCTPGRKKKNESVSSQVQIPIIPRVHIEPNDDTVDVIGDTSTIVSFDDCKTDSQLELETETSITSVVDIARIPVVNPKATVKSMEKSKKQNPGTDYSSLESSPMLGMKFEQNVILGRDRKDHVQPDKPSASQQKSSCKILAEKDIDLAQGPAFCSFKGLVQSKKTGRKRNAGKTLFGMESIRMNRKKVGRNENISKKSTADMFTAEKKLKLLAKSRCVDTAEKSTELTETSKVLARRGHRGQKRTPQDGLSRIESLAKTKLQYENNITEFQLSLVRCDKYSPKLQNQSGTGAPHVVDQLDMEQHERYAYGIRPDRIEEPQQNQRRNYVQIEQNNKLLEDSHSPKDESCLNPPIDKDVMEYIKSVWVYRHTGPSGLFTYKRGRTMRSAETISHLFKTVYEPVVVLSPVVSSIVTGGATPLPKLLRLEQAEVTARRNQRKINLKKVEIKSPCLYGVSTNMQKLIRQPPWFTGKRKLPEASSLCNEPTRKKTSFAFEGQAAALDITLADDDDAKHPIEETTSHKLVKLCSDQDLGSQIDIAYWGKGDITISEKEPPLAENSVSLRTNENGQPGVACHPMDQSKPDVYFLPDVIDEVDTSPDSLCTLVEGNTGATPEQDPGENSLEYTSIPIHNHIENVNSKCTRLLEECVSMNDKGSAKGEIVETPNLPETKIAKDKLPRVFYQTGDTLPDTDIEEIKFPNVFSQTATTFPGTNIDKDELPNIVSQRASTLPESTIENDKLPNVVKQTTSIKETLTLPDNHIVKDNLTNVISQTASCTETPTILDTDVAKDKLPHVAKQKQRRQKPFKCKKATNGLTFFRQRVSSYNTSKETNRKGIKIQSKNRINAEIGKKVALKGKPNIRLLDSNKSKCRFESQSQDTGTHNYTSSVTPKVGEQHNKCVPLQVKTVFDQLNEERQKDTIKSTPGFYIDGSNESLLETLGNHAQKSSDSNAENSTTVNEALNQCLPLPSEVPVIEASDNETLTKGRSSLQGVLEQATVGEADHVRLTENTRQKMAINYLLKEFNNRLHALQAQGQRPLDNDTESINPQDKASAGIDQDQIKSPYMVAKMAEPRHGKVYKPWRNNWQTQSGNMAIPLIKHRRAFEQIELCSKQPETTPQQSQIAEQQPVKGQHLSEEDEQTSVLAHRKPEGAVQHELPQQNPQVLPEQPGGPPQQPIVPQQELFVPMSPFGTPLVQPNGQLVVMRHIRPPPSGPHCSQEQTMFNHCTPIVSIADTNYSGQKPYIPTADLSSTLQAVSLGTAPTMVGYDSQGISIASSLVKPLNSVQQTQAVAGFNITTGNPSMSKYSPATSIAVEKRPPLYSSIPAMSKKLNCRPTFTNFRSNFQLSNSRTVVLGSPWQLPAPRAHSQKSSLRVLMDKPIPAHSRPANYSMYSQLACSVEPLCMTSGGGLDLTKNKIGLTSNASLLKKNRQLPIDLKSSASISLTTNLPAMVKQSLQRDSAKTDDPSHRAVRQTKPLHKARKSDYFKKPMPDHQVGKERQVKAKAQSVSQQSSDVSSMMVPLSCQTCSKMSTFLCSGCYTVAYCSVKCQTVAWDLHFPVCK